MKTCKSKILSICVACMGTWIVPGGVLLSGCQSPVDIYYSGSTPQGFAVQSVRISALTDFVVSADDPEKSEIKTFVELLDAYDSQLKKPCIFRFELYEFQALSSNPRGRRLIIWPDMDLTGLIQNNQQWRDYLRSYEFYLPLGFSPQPEKNYLLEVTCLIGDRRLNDLSKIRFRP